VSSRPAGAVIRWRAPGPILVLVALVAGVLPVTAPPSRAAAPVDHLVISEIVTGGVSASDELIEIYNPSGAVLPLEGLELVYVSASGLTVSRRAAWELGAPLVPPGHHVLVANELGAYVGIADALYASGMAATGGSVALRIIGASTAIDAVGWGTAASAWLEGSPASAPPGGASIERRPGGAQGSTQDTDDNVADFVVRDVPDPRNLASPPVPDPSSTPTPVPSDSAAATPSLSIGASPSPATSPTPTASASPTPAPSAGPTVVTIAAARGLPDATTVTVEGTSLSASTFTDGGGFLADATAGIAVLVTDGSFTRGTQLRLTGTVDDRYAQRTLRVSGAGIQELGSAADPAAGAVATGGVGEVHEGTLVRITGRIVAGPTSLAAGPAYDVDDGSGAVRVLVADGTGIDLTAWVPDAVVDLVGVAGQRDSSGTGVAGYRVLPRDAADVRSVAPPASAEPIPSGSAGPTPSPSASSTPEGVLTISAARSLPKNAVARVRGVVTMPPGVVDPTTAVVQDATGAIALRLGEEVGRLSRGTAVDVTGVRSTLSGMETLRVSTPATNLGSTSEPAPRSIRTGDAGERLEARLVVARGAIVAALRRSSRGTVSFEIDDGSGPLRVAVGAALRLEPSGLAAGTWVSVTGVLGQETTGSAPTRGYRVWPRALGDVVVTAPAAGSSNDDGAPPGTDGTGGPGTPAGSGTGGTATATLEAVGGTTAPGLPIGATLVVGPWDELRIGGVLWDGERAVALDASAVEAVAAVLGARRPPMALEISALAVTGTHEPTGLAVAAPPTDPAALVASGAAIAAPATELPGPRDGARWVTVLGRIHGDGTTLRPAATAADVALEHRCDAGRPASRGIVSVSGLAVPDPLRIVVPCESIVRAPALGRVLTDATASTLGTLVTHGVGALSLHPQDATGAPVAVAVLLALGSGALLVGSFVARQLADEDTDDEAGPASEAVGADEDPGSAPAAAPGPALRLVPLPRERAP
jgi:hypothetical protein